MISTFPSPIHRLNAFSNARGLTFIGLAMAGLIFVQSAMGTNGFETDFGSMRLMTTLDQIKAAGKSDTEQEAKPLPSDPAMSINLENDVMGVRVWGPPTQPTLSIGHSDIWDRRSFHQRDKIFRLAEIKELAAKGDINRVRDNDGKGYGTNAYRKYDFPISKPAGQFILGTPFGESATITRHNFSHATLVVEGNGKVLTAEIHVLLDSSRVLVEVTQSGLKAEDFWVRTYRHRDTITPGTPVCLSMGGRASGTDFEQLPAPLAFEIDGKVGGVIQSFPPERTFPQGFQAALAATLGLGATEGPVSVKMEDGKTGLGTKLEAVDGKEGRISHMTVKRYTPINQAEGAAATLRAGALPERFAIVAAVATTQSPNETNLSIERLAADSALALAVQEPAARLAGIENARKQALRPARAKASVDGITIFEAPEFQIPSLRQPGGYYGDLAMGSVGSTKFQYQDQGIWKHSITFNEVRGESLVTLGMLPEVWNYARHVHRILPSAEAHAQEIYGLPGAKFPLNDFPLDVGGFVHTNQVWEKDMGLNGLVTKPLWLYYLMTGDKEYLRDIAYPVLKSASVFMEAYLTPNDDGAYEIVPTVSPEHWGLTNQFERNKNSTSALTLTRYLFNATAQAAEELGVGDDWTKGLREKAQKLVPFPTTRLENSQQIWTDVEGAPNSGVDGREDYNIAVPLTPVFWGDEVGVDSPDRILDMATRTLQNIKVWQPHITYLDRARIRLGLDTNRLTPESFLLSYQSLNVFPAIPKGHSAQFENLRAQGAFLVSASRNEEGRVTALSVQSLAGNPLKLRNPWPGEKVTIVDGAGKSVEPEQTRHHILLTTEPGQTYHFQP